MCRSGVIASGRLERTDRAEEEPGVDPFRVPRPATDLSNFGVSRWTTVTASIAAPAYQAGRISGRPFVEVAWITARAGKPPGLFSSEFRYGASRMTMISAGVRLRTGMRHERMGRYGAALFASPTSMKGMETHNMQHMAMTHTSAGDRCAVQ
jgi:hypothetical protein